MECTGDIRDFLGKKVCIKIDRPLGSAHPVHRDMIYPVNYGYIPDVIGGDGEEQDVYLLGVSEPVKEYTAQVIGIVYRKNDAEDKLIAAPQGMHFSREQVLEAIQFQEQYFRVSVVLMEE